jgi:hypothetical protein
MPLKNIFQHTPFYRLSNRDPDEIEEQLAERVPKPKAQQAAE